MTPRIPPPPTDLEGRLARYVELIRGSPHNLMSPRGLEELEVRHLPECLELAARLPPGPRTLVDVGSGAGLPGLVVAARRADLQVTLVEATRKKATFLEQAASALAVSVEVRWGRIEELARTGFAARFDLATARAVAPLDRLVAWIVPVLRPGGELWAVKGERWASELAEAADALSDADAEVVATPDGSSAPGQPRVVTIRRRVRAPR